MTASSNGVATGRSIAVMDLHSDVLLRLLEEGGDMGVDHPWLHVTLPKLVAGGVTDQVCAVWVDSRAYPGVKAVERSLATFDVADRQFAKYSDRMGLALTAAEAAAIRASGRIAVYLWVEGGDLINNDLEILRMYHRRGARGMTLTWTTNVPWAGSNTDPVNPNMGLTDFGREVVGEMNRLGMIVDVSHVSERSVMDVLEVSSAPVIASHSGCRAVCPSPRNLSDEAIAALAKKGGVIGMMAVPQFLRLDWTENWDALADSMSGEVTALLAKYGGVKSAPYNNERRWLIQNALPEEQRSTLEHFLDHLMHVVRIGGVECAALGSDFDGYWGPTVGLEDAAKWPLVAEGLRRRGVADDEVAAIMGGNARRVFGEVIG